MAAYNTRLGNNFLVGITAGMERRNNLTNLTQITFETTTVAIPAGTTTDFVKTHTGYKGAVLRGVTASWNGGKAKVSLVASYTFGGAVNWRRFTALAGRAS